jgi:hypothetical protein
MQRVDGGVTGKMQGVNVFQRESQRVAVRMCGADVWMDGGMDAKSICCLNEVNEETRNKKERERENKNRRRTPTRALLSFLVFGL